jgi:[acyl-carrier-protein] S-malonyltransferase
VTSVIFLVVLFLSSTSLFSFLVVRQNADDKRQQLLLDPSHIRIHRFQFFIIKFLKKLFLSLNVKMVRVLASSLMLLSASRLASTFSPAVRSIGKRSFSSLSASDSDFDDFSAKTAFMFPGQGAQFVGMCGDVVKDVPAAKALFDEASEILGYDLLEICTEGPKEKLDSTVISQPAIFVASMAAVEKLKQEKGQEALDAATVAMGLSLGEYSALCFAGAISFADGVKITKARGEAMQAASDAVDTGMVSVIGLDSDKVKELCAMASDKSGEKIQIANYLCKGNYAVSGSSKACDAVAELAKPEFKARMTVKLAVAGAFHTGKFRR